LHIICIQFTSYHFEYIIFFILLILADSVQQMLRMQATSNVILKDIQQRLLKIETAIKHRALSPAKIRDDLIVPFLPLTTITVIKEFDILLKTSDEAVIQFVSTKILALLAH